MSATLTPIEAPVIDMTVYEEHWDDKVPCMACESEASARLRLKCCGRIAGTICDPCYRTVLEDLAFLMSPPSDAQLSCAFCGTAIAAPRKPTDVYAEEPL